VKRRAFVALAALCGAPRFARAEAAFAPVTPRPLVFPRDHGSHPDFRTEWWYVTGWTRDTEGVERGVQVTFFRSRPGVAEDLASALAPRQVLFAHVAVADPRTGTLLHDQRAARAVLGLAGASEATTDVWIDDWRFALDGDTYRAHVAARELALDLAFRASDPPLLQGDEGVSRKGPLPAHASYYYSRPQLAVSGELRIGNRATRVEGRAWLDHEWSSEYLAPGATGWDWTGIDLDDGGALMAFRIRDARGGTLWAGGTWRHGDGRVERLAADAVAFEPLRSWRSPRTGVEYPVSMRVRAGGYTATLAPLFDDQELDARASVGTMYWEGAVRASGTTAGRGYLELTGYAGALKL
jgi:predicted secreted hydrolase